MRPSHLAVIVHNPFLNLNGDVSEVTWLAPPVIPDVPIAFPRSGNWFFSVPIAKGDSGMVIMCDRSIDVWRSKGRESPNVDGRIHDLSDAVFYPGLVPMGRELSSAIDSDLVIGDDANPSSQIRVKAGGGGVVIGDESAAKAVAIAEKVEAELEAIKDAIVNAVPGTADGGAALQTSIGAALVNFPDDVSTSKVAAE